MARLAGRENFNPMPRMLEYLLGLAVTVGVLAFAVWLLVRAFKKSDDPMRLLSRWIITIIVLPGIVLAMSTGFLAPIFCAAIAIVIAIVWTPSWVTILLKPLTNALDGGSETDPKPLYSIAESKRKLGKYFEAIAAIQEELIRFPRDFQGQMLIAEIQAVNMRDLPAAQQTIEAFLVQEGHTAANLTFALNRLADWQAAGGDVAAAHRCLEEICARYPDTEYAYHASQRLAHLNPGLQEEKKQSRRIVVPQREEGLIARRANQEAAAPVEDWEGKVRELIAQLEAYPADNDAREHLALIYARQYQQLEVALDQFEQMITQPGVPARRVVRWLNLMADLQVTEGENLAAARLALQRIVDLNPEAPDAEKARQRMLYLNLDLKGQQAGTSVKMEPSEKKPEIPKTLPRLAPRLLPDFLKGKPKA
jgi:tetratricopeptide (TPR) repeat protein